MKPDMTDRQILKMTRMQFTPCVRAGLLLKRTAATAKRGWGGGRRLRSCARSGFDPFQNRLRPAVQVRPMNKLTLTSREVFRGKISRPKTQPILKERTQSAPSR
jgi:hypothetical protein